MNFSIDTASPMADVPAVDYTPAPKPARNNRVVEFYNQYERTLKARYDAAGLSPEMESWWANADKLSPRAAANKNVRARIRERARYEVYESGSIAQGMLEALTNAVIGCGPTLQMQTEDKELNKRIEKEWAAFAKAIRLTSKLRTMFAAKIVDGEAFAEKVTNPTLKTPVKFDIRLSECDMWTDPQYAGHDPNEDDGIRYDSFGNPILYRRMKQHPGDDVYVSHNPWEVEPIPARYVLHWFKETRPGQRRGVSEFASSLRPLAELRRYQMAVQAAAETAANHAGVMFSTVDAYQQDPTNPEGDPFMEVPTARNSLLQLPEGWDMKQLKAEQPTTKYVEFVEERVSAASRPIQMPLNIAIGSSKNHNFASATLDHRQFRAANRPRQKDCDDVVLDVVFSWWLFEANRIEDYLPPLPDDLPHAWIWDKDEPIDIAGQAAADETYFNIGWLTDERYCKREGLDIDDMGTQWKEQTKRREAAGENFPQPGVQKSESIQDDSLQPAGAS